MCFYSGQKVIFRGTIYDFGYYSQTPDMCVLYYEGERNAQDSFAVKVNEVVAA